MDQRTQRSDTLKSRVLEASLLPDRVARRANGFLDPATRNREVFLVPISAETARTIVRVPRARRIHGEDDDFVASCTEDKVLVVIPATGPAVADLHPGAKVGRDAGGHAVLVVDWGQVKRNGNCVTPASSPVFLCDSDILSCSDPETGKTMWNFLVGVKDGTPPDDDDDESTKQDIRDAGDADTGKQHAKESTKNDESN